MANRGRDIRRMKASQMVTSITNRGLPPSASSMISSMHNRALQFPDGILTKAGLIDEKGREEAFIRRLTTRRVPGRGGQTMGLRMERNAELKNLMSKPLPLTEIERRNLPRSTGREYLSRRTEILEGAARKSKAERAVTSAMKGFNRQIAAETTAGPMAQSMINRALGASTGFLTNTPESKASSMINRALAAPEGNLTKGAARMSPELAAQRHNIGNLVRGYGRGNINISRTNFGPETLSNQRTANEMIKLNRTRPFGMPARAHASALNMGGAAEIQGPGNINMKGSTPLSPRSVAKTATKAAKVGRGINVGMIKGVLKGGAIAAAVGGAALLAGTMAYQAANLNYTGTPTRQSYMDSEQDIFYPSGPAGGGPGSAMGGGRDYRMGIDGGTALALHNNRRG